MIYRELIEQVTDFFSKEERYLQEIVAAKEIFFQKTGKVFEDDPQYEGRMAAFVEWFMLDRPLTRVGLAPVRYYYEMFEASLAAETREQLKCLFQSIHSLFLFRSRNRHTVAVEDLFDDRTYEVSEKRQYVGISPGTVFEGRIVRKGEQMVFSDTYCVHPIDAANLIRKETNKYHTHDRDAFLELILKLAARRLRCDRYKKVNIASIYNLQNGDDLSNLVATV